MDKYISLDGLDIRYYKAGTDVSRYIDKDKYRLMTDSEITEHESVGLNLNDEQKRLAMPILKPIDFDIKLNNAKLYDAIQELIKDNFELRIAYTRATYFSRTDPFIIQASEALGLTPEQVDEIWTS